MNSSDFRAEARKKLEGKWGKVAVITLAYMAIFFILGFIEGLFKEGSFMQTILSIVSVVVEVPLAFGLLIALFKVFNEEDVKAFDFFSLGFNNFAKSWKICFNTILKVIVPFILIVVSIVLICIGIFATAASALVSSASGGLLFFSLIGLILFIAAYIWLVMKSYYYSLAYIIAVDKPELEAKQAVEESKKIMTGNRGKLFGLQFSFIGWAILGIFTFGIGYLWLLPYIQFATFVFYKKISGNADVEVEHTIENDGPIQ